MESYTRRPQVKRGPLGCCEVTVVNLDGRIMHVSATDELGVVGSGTELRFVQSGGRVVAKYAGGTIRRGCLIGHLHGAKLDWSYLQREASGQLHWGRSVCDLVEQSDGRIRIVEHFQWHSRPGAGVNVFEEPLARD